jgi:hypothetical protein
VEHVYNSGTTLWTSGKEEKEKRMIEHWQYHKTVSVNKEDIRMCIESCQKWEVGGKGVKGSN